MKRIPVFLILAAVITAACQRVPTDRIFLEAESFDDYGGWVNDAQFLDQMGSPYLMAHGMGVPVEDAVHTFTVQEQGEYHVYVRTFNWVAPFGAGPAPGRFTITIDGRQLDTVFGTSPEEWGWTGGGVVAMDTGVHEIRLQDLTGFNGRVDAIFLSRSPSPNLPNDPHNLFMLRKQTGAIPREVIDAGDYDLVVVGGGIAGICSAVSASRLGLKTALIQNRPVLGGNNSSEVRVHLVGRTDRNLYPSLGSIVRALDDHHPPNAATADKYQDSLKLELVRAEPNLDLYLNTHMNWVDTRGDRITDVYAINTHTGQRYRFGGKLFTDCTGDGTLGYLAGADYRYGRESRDETGEPSAPAEADSMTMGTSNLWYATEKEKPSTFPECRWALSFTGDYYIDKPRGTWRWESGFDRHIIEEAEYIRDHNLRAIYGNWSFLKNHLSEKYNRYSLDWVGYVAGKRESRRLMGDVVLSETDIMDGVKYDDAAVTLTWGIDVHFPDSLNSIHYPGREFISWYNHPHHPPYHMPYRCLYSRNVENLFMAGRNISVTHYGLGSPRVMRTTGMMGEVTGMAASVCVENECLPADVYTDHLEMLKALMREQTEPLNN